MAEGTEAQEPEHSDVQGGGGASRGPNPDPGGEEEPGGLVPPYEGRTTGQDSPSSKARAAAVEEQLAGADPGRPGATSSPADERPAGDDQATAGAPDSPKGVGGSPNRSGEDIVDDEGKEPGRHDAGTQGESERPVGTSDERDMTGIDP